MEDFKRLTDFNGVSSVIRGVLRVFSGGENFFFFFFH